MEIAINYCKQYISDIDVYEFDFCDDIKDSYYFAFIRRIGGVRTCDRACVWVLKDGTVYHHYFPMPGEMRDAKLPTNEEMKIILAKVDIKIDEIHETLNYGEVTQHNIDEERTVFMRLEDGSYGLKFGISTSFSGTDFQNYTEILVTWNE